MHHGLPWVNLELVSKLGVALGTVSPKTSSSYSLIISSSYYFVSQKRVVKDVHPKMNEYVVQSKNLMKACVETIV